MPPINLHQLHHGPYTPPALRRGDRATCVYRDGDVVITSWSDGRISWPRCRRLDTRGGTGLLVDEELARAVRLESSLAIQHWWGVTESTVWKWRQALGVPWFNEGSTRLRNELNVELGAGLKGKRLPPEQVERRRRTAKELGLRPVQRPGGRPWTTKELGLLGTMTDDDLATEIGRTERAVRVMRLRQGIPVAKDRRRREHHTGSRTWTDSELALLGTVPDSELAARIGRTQGAIEVMRARRGIPTAKDRRAGRKMPSRRSR
jgi:hypothetical protein